MLTQNLHRPSLEKDTHFRKRENHEVFVVVYEQKIKVLFLLSCKGNGWRKFLIQNYISDLERKKKLKSLTTVTKLSENVKVTGRRAP